MPVPSFGLRWVSARRISRTRPGISSRRCRRTVIVVLLGASALTVTDLRADTPVVTDLSTTYSLPIQPQSFPCIGSCDLLPSFNHYVIASPFAITKITFKAQNVGGNNCDGVGNYAASISSTPDQIGIVATSKNSAYLGCAGFGPNHPVFDVELDFAGQAAPASFYLDFATVDGAVQGGANIQVFDVVIWGSVAPTTPAGVGNDPTTVSAFSAEPINTGNGNYVYQHQDFHIAGRGIPLNFVRTYNSLDGYSGPLGHNWTHNFNIRLTADLSGASIRWGDGHIESFSLAGGIYSPPRGVFSTLTSNLDGSFALLQKDQTHYNFSSAGQLTGIVDRNGNTTSFLYGEGDCLTQIVDAVGRTLTLTYDSTNRISRVDDPLGRHTAYEYDGDGNLVRSTDTADGATSYAYDANHRMTSIILPNGQVLAQNSYDSTGRVIAQTNGRGLTWTFAYDSPNTLSTTITDARGFQTIHTYDGSLRILATTDALSGAVAYTYDENNDRTSITNQKGRKSTFSYDANGNLVQVNNALGSISTFTYSSTNNVLTATNPKGKTTTFLYDGSGNLAALKDALDGKRTFAYDSYGQLISTIDARGNATSYAYDVFGNLVNITDSLGHTLALSYDGIGRLTKITDANGHSSNANYDVLDRLISVSDGLNNQTRFAYDAVGNLLTVTDANGHTTSYLYDATNNLVSVTDALGHVTKYGYDETNNRVKFTDAKGNSTAYAFDALNRLVQIVDPLFLSTSYSYDPIGNVLAVTDPKGQTNQFAYDALNRLLAISYADGKQAAYSFDGDGNRISMVDSRGLTKYAYDDLDRLRSVVNPDGKSVSYGFDANGNRNSVTYPDGKIVTYSYDRTNRLSIATDWRGRATTFSYDPAGHLVETLYPNQAAVSFLYDAANRLTQVSNSYRGSGDFPLNPVTSFTYVVDAVGNRTQVTDGSGKVTSYGYDALNELVSVTSGTSVIRYSYDAAGNRLTMTAPGTSVSYAYDADDRMLASGSLMYAYDANGNLTSRTMTATGSPISYSYDAANRLVAASGPVASAFSYDGDGTRVSQTVSSGTYSYVNDVANRSPVVLQESGPDGNISYAYGLGLISASSSVFDYFYHHDGLGSVVGLTESSGKLAGRYTYDVWGAPDLSVANPQIGTKNKFRFTGELLDPGIQLYYLRARYYDSATGRFNKPDPLIGLLRSPLSLNRFNYALANPTRYVDPSGLSPMDSEGVGNDQGNTSELAGPVFQNSFLPKPGPAFQNAAENFIVDETLGGFLSAAKSLLVTSYDLLSQPTSGAELAAQGKNLVVTVVGLLSKRAVGFVLGVINLLSVPEVANAPSSKP